MMEHGLIDSVDPLQSAMVPSSSEHMVTTMILSGAVYLFEKSPSDTSSWMQVAKLTSDDGEANDRFGISFGISDGTIVVGAH